MEWITNLLSSLAKVLTPIFGMIIFLMRRKEVRAAKYAKINQQHREGILLVLWYNPKEFDSRCIQSLQILSGAANLAEGFDKRVCKDIKDTENKIQELRQNFGFLKNRDLTPKNREHFSEKNANINLCLMTKLNRI